MVATTSILKCGAEFAKSGDMGKATQTAKDNWKKYSLGYKMLGGEASDAAKEASEAAADSEAAKLEYLKEREALPMAFRDAAMVGLGQEYGLTFDESGNMISDGTSLNDRALSSPFYQQQLQEGENAIGRSSSATGRLRGGATPTMLGANAQSAYTNAYNQQLQGLNSFAYGPSNTNKIADTMGNVGSILAQGQVAQAQAQQQGLGTAAGLGMSALMAFSDPRLKDNVKVIGSYKGLDLGSWDWNKEAEELGLKGSDTGVMADQVADKYPNCVGEKSGYMTVDHGKLANE